VNGAVIELSKVIRVHYGAALKEADREQSGAHHVYGSSGVVGRHSESLFEYPSIVIGRKGSVGAVTYAPEGGWAIDTAFFVERLDPNASDLRYLFYALKNARLARHTITTSIPGLSRDDIYRTRIRLPGLDEQRRIADILDKADAIRRKRKEAIALTEELLRSAFLEMFGDPVTNPKSWPVKPLGELLAYLTSGSRGWAQHYADSGETFLRIQNVRKDLLDLSDVAFVQAPDSAEAKRTETKPGDVLLSITADLGRTAVVPASLPRAFINQHLAILRPQGVNAEYLSAFLASEGGQLQINRRNKGGVKAGLNFDDIRSVEVLLPPVAAQDKFATAKRRIRATNADIERALLHDDDLFNSLVARAFSGALEKAR